MDKTERRIHDTHYTHDIHDIHYITNKHAIMLTKLEKRIDDQQDVLLPCDKPLFKKIKGLEN